MMDSLNSKEGRIDLSKPRYDQSVYWGRAKHFFTIANPLNVLATDQQLYEAKKIVLDYRQGRSNKLTDDEVWKAKHLYDSAFHPETGEKMFVLGRMSFQVPGNMLITGCMLNFYKTTPAVLFWQWVNQSFNAIVNYTNRSGDSPISNGRLAAVYVMATSSAVVTALSVNYFARSLPPLVGRLGPFAAVSTANCINIPMMRSNELQDGLAVFSEDGRRVGSSVMAAKTSIVQVILSRIGMAIPGMTLPPILMNQLEKRGVLGRMPWIGAPLQIALCGFMLTFTTPLCCAIFPQMSSLQLEKFEPEIQAAALSMGLDPKKDRLFFNKGL